MLNHRSNLYPLRTVIDPVHDGQVGIVELSAHFVLFKQLWIIQVFFLESFQVSYLLNSFQVVYPLILKILVPIQHLLLSKILVELEHGYGTSLHP